MKVSLSPWAKERLGAAAIEELRKGPKIFVTAPQRSYFGQWYFYTADIPLEDLIISQEEVAAIRWVALAELERWLLERPSDFLQSTSQWLPRLLTP